MRDSGSLILNHVKAIGNGDEGIDAEEVGDVHVSNVLALDNLGDGIKVEIADNVSPSTIRHFQETTTALI